MESRKDIQMKPLRTCGSNARLPHVNHLHFPFRYNRQPSRPGWRDVRLQAFVVICGHRYSMTRSPYQWLRSGLHVPQLAKRHTIDRFHNSQNAPVPYPTMLHSEQKCAHFCSEWSIVGYETGAFWDLLIWSIVTTSATSRDPSCDITAIEL